jgi:hypothetical protein
VHMITFKKGLVAGTSVRSSVLHDLRSRAWLGGSQAGGELGQK